MKKLMLGLVAAFAVTAFADPSVKIDKVETASPWVGDEGKIKVDYSLAGIDAEAKYKVVFEISAGGKTASVTNDAAKLIEGKQQEKAIDTVTLFGKEIVDKDAEVKISLIVELGGVQLWEGGPFFAECNVGATKPEEYGWYFWWGDTVGYTNNGSGASSKWVSVVDGKTTISFDNSAPANSTYGKTAAELASGGWVDNGNLVSTNDAATAKLGAPWRMMTDSELQTFTERTDDKKVCNWTWTERNGVKGYLVTGAKDGYKDKSIFLPSAGSGDGSRLNGTGLEGHYWSSTPTPLNSYRAQYLNFYQYGFRAYSNYRYYGYVVRPVR